MPLTSKLRTDYIELINQQLDNLPLETLEDFDLVRGALSNIMPPKPSYQARFFNFFSQNPTRIGVAVPEKYQESMDHIKSFLEEAESYVQDRANDNEYKHIIRDRITAKINELRLLSKPQKQAYIQAQSDRLTQVRANQATMSQHQAPAAGSEARTLTEQQWFEEQTQVANSDNRTDNTLALVLALLGAPLANPTTLNLSTPNLEERNENGASLLSIAIHNRHIEFIRFLLTSGLGNPRTQFQTEIPAVPPRNNHALLREINFSGEIPMEYACPVSLNIMDDPVYDHNDPNGPLSARFERSAIMASLRQREENPVLLLSDRRLQNEINDFVQRAINIGPRP